MSEKLKPCPFCGNKDIDTSPISGAAWCYDCHSVSNDVDRWNTRPIENALQSRIAVLEAALVEIRKRIMNAIPNNVYWQHSLAYKIGEMADRALKGEVKE